MVRRHGMKTANFLSIMLVPCILLCHNLNYYKSILFYSEFYWLTFLYLLAPLTLCFLLNNILRFNFKTSVFLTIHLSVFFFFFGAIQDFLLSNFWTSYFGKTYVLIFIFLGIAVYIKIKRHIADKLLKIISVILGFLFLSELCLFILTLKNFNEGPNLKNKAALTTSVDTNVDSFNIYHIVFDGYTNSKTLKKEFGFNNPIDSFLRYHNFFVADKTKSNYNFTPYSIAATLNFQYLSLQDEMLERTNKNFFLGTGIYLENATFRFLKERGYKIQTFSILDDYNHLKKLGTFFPRLPAFSIRYQTLERVILNPWLWKKLSGANNKSIPEDIKRSMKYYISYNQTAFNNIISSAAPKGHLFNFTHFLVPHEPYVYMSTAPDSLTLDHLKNHRQGYISQLQYANDLIRKLVVELKKNKKNIIVVQGDHGFREYDLLKTSPLQQFETFNAFYFPNQNYSALYDSISLVNTYRVILSEYFHQSLPLLKD